MYAHSSLILLFFGHGNMYVHWPQDLLRADFAATPILYNFIRFEHRILA